LRLTGITSLDIQLPSRGVDFYFKSPRGGATVTARPVDAQSVSRWFSALVWLAIAVVGWFGGRVMLAIGSRAAAKTIAAWGLLLVGLVSLVTGTLPIYGLLAVCASIVLFVERVGGGRASSEVSV